MMNTKNYEDMSLEELKAEYERIGNLNFYLQMKNTWTSSDRNQAREYHEKTLKLLKLIDERGGEHGTENEP